MAGEVLVWQRLTKAGLHNAQDWQEYGLARRNKRTTYKTGMTRQVSTLNVLARQPNT